MSIYTSCCNVIRSCQNPRCNPCAATWSHVFSFWYSVHVRPGHTFGRLYFRPVSTTHLPMKLTSYVRLTSAISFLRVWPRAAVAAMSLCVPRLLKVCAGVRCHCAGGNGGKTDSRLRYNKISLFFRYSRVRPEPVPLSSPSFERSLI